MQEIAEISGRSPSNKKYKFYSYLYVHFMSHNVGGVGSRGLKALCVFLDFYFMWRFLFWFLNLIDSFIWQHEVQVLVPRLLISLKLEFCKELSRIGWYLLNSTTQKVRSQSQSRASVPWIPADLEKMTPGSSTQVIEQTEIQGLQKIIRERKTIREQGSSKIASLKPRRSEKRSQDGWRWLKAN